MKQYILIILILFIFSCKAQNIVPYDSDQDIYISNSGDYYKDTNNVFNPFVGEWKWEDNSSNSLLTLNFEKIENLDSGENFTYDLLVGEYRYVQNGTELANTLIDINNSNIIGEYHKISGMLILTKYNRPQCNECSENEKRMQVSIQHDNYPGVQGKLIMRQFTESGIEKLKVIVKDGPWLSNDDNAPDNIDIPFGEYILVKQ